MAPDLLHIRIKDHQTSLHSSFLHLFSSQDSKINYDDATIACGGKLYPVHRLVLSVCSDYFAAMFAATSAVGRHPIIVLKDIPSDIFEVLLKFIYIGEVNIERSKFSALVDAARCLKVRSLASYKYDANSENPDKSHDVSPKPAEKRKVVSEEASADEQKSPKVTCQRSRQLTGANDKQLVKQEDSTEPQQPPSQVSSMKINASLKLCSVRLSPVELYTPNEEENDKKCPNKSMPSKKYGCKLCDFKTRFRGAMTLHLRKHVRLEQKKYENKLYTKKQTKRCMSLRTAALNKYYGRSLSKKTDIKMTEIAIDEAKIKNEWEIAGPSICKNDKPDSDQHSGFHLPVQKEITFSCTYDNKKSARKFSVASPVPKAFQNDPLQCSLCFLHFGTKSKLLSHNLTHKQVNGFYRCCYCDFSSRDLSSLEIHHRVHMDEKSFKCFFCAFSSRSPYGLRSHYEKESHPFQTLANCPKCPYASKESSELEEHVMYSHPEGNAPYKCPICSFLASDRSQYIEHMRSHPPQTKSWFCVSCYYCTYDLKAFNFHVKTRHKKKKNISVGQPAPKKSALKREKKTRTEETDLGKIGANHGKSLNEMNESESEMFSSPAASFAKPKPVRSTSPSNERVIKLGKKRYKCPLCSFTALKRAHVQKHLRRHTGEQPYACTECLYRSSRYNSLVSHMKQHRRNLPFKCTHCSFTTAYQSLLRNHEVRDHAIDDLDDISATYDIAIESHCPHCPLSCNDRESLLSHIAQEHPESTSVNIPSTSSTLFSDCPAVPAEMSDASLNPISFGGANINSKVRSDNDSCISFVPETSPVNDPDSAGNPSVDMNDSHPFSNVQLKVIKPSLMDMVDVIDDPTYEKRVSVETYLSVDNPENPFIMKTADRKYRCNDCFFLTSDPEVMKQHLSEYLASKPYECDRCDFRFKFAVIANNHKMKRKDSKKLYECPICKVKMCFVTKHLYECYHQACAENEPGRSHRGRPLKLKRRQLQLSAFEFSSSTSNRKEAGENINLLPSSALIKERDPNNVAEVNKQSEIKIDNEAMDDKHIGSDVENAMLGNSSRHEVSEGCSGHDSRMSDEQNNFSDCEQLKELLNSKAAEIERIGIVRNDHQLKSALEETSEKMKKCKILMHQINSSDCSSKNSDRSSRSKANANAEVLGGAANLQGSVGSETNCDFQTPTEAFDENEVSEIDNQNSHDINAVEIECLQNTTDLHEQQVFETNGLKSLVRETSEDDEAMDISLIDIDAFHPAIKENFSGVDALRMVEDCARDPLDISDLPSCSNSSLA
ncbi:uncharacterized protein LOC108679130 [Hyalella azteca]|uniref:Uncharacterized protein LOC108679130 n=1 Tax=Hyalella azteca TaxID=294128 RepID=A0A8B7PAL8_HYAAZ|nr:uncharacterized protein LOC108679130 [Hyalella azteca]